MNLRIDTADKDKITAAVLVNSEKVILEKSDYNSYGSQVLLPLVLGVLEEAGIKFEDLEGVEVNTGPGSFTGLKVGVAVANALAFGLNIPVNGKELEMEVVYK